VKADVAARASEISRRPDLKILGPHLRNNFPLFKEALIKSAGQDPEARINTLMALVDSYNLPEVNARAVKDYVEANLK
jgi:hypothetical protein